MQEYLRFVKEHSVGDNRQGQDLIKVNKVR